MSTLLIALCDVSTYARTIIIITHKANMLCRQVGRELHELKPALPLFDGVTGQPVPQTVDSRVERLRDALMDDARERVDDLGEDLVVGKSPACGAVVCMSACVMSV